MSAPRLPVIHARGSTTTSQGDQGGFTPVSHGRPLPCQSCLLSCRVCPTAARYSRSGSTTTSPGDQGGFIPPSHTAARYHVSPACFRAVSAPRLPVIHARARPPHLPATRAGLSPRLTRPPATMSVLACFRAVSHPRFNLTAQSMPGQGLQRFCRLCSVLYGLPLFFSRLCRHAPPELAR